MPANQDAKALTLMNEDAIAVVEEKWSGVVDGLDLRHATRGQVSLILDTNSKYLKRSVEGIDEIVKTAGLDEGVNGRAGLEQSKIIGIVAKSWASSILPALVSVQPMTAPVGAVVYFSQSEVKSVDGVPEVRLSVEVDEIVAQTRSLKTKLTSENVAADLSDEIAREVLGDLWSSCEKIEYGPRDEITQVLHRGSTEIHKITKRAPANYAVCSSNVIKKLRQLARLDETGVLDRVAEAAEGSDRVSLVGVWNSRMKIFEDRKMPKSGIVLGYQGHALLDTGYIYSPYIYIIPSLNEADGDWLRTRHAKRLVNPSFYRRMEMAS